MKKKTKRTRAPGGGRKLEYGESTKRVNARLPIKIITLLDGLGPSRTAALVAIVRGSVQYRREYGAKKPS